MHTLLLRLKWNWYTWVNDFLDFIALFLLLSLLFILFYFVSLFIVINFANLFLGHENFRSPSKTIEENVSRYSPLEIFYLSPFFKLGRQKNFPPLNKVGGLMRFSSVYCILLIYDTKGSAWELHFKFKQI